MNILNLIKAMSNYSYHFKDFFQNYSNNFIFFVKICNILCKDLQIS